MGSFHSPVAAAGCPGISWQDFLPPLSVFFSIITCAVPGRGMVSQARLPGVSRDSSSAAIKKWLGLKFLAPTRCL